MPSITIRRVPLASTRSYEAPPRSFPRVRMTRNGVQMLAAVNGRGAYALNGPKRKRRRARRAYGKAKLFESLARQRRISRRKRYKYKRQAARYRRKARKLRRKAEYKAYVRRMAKKAGLTRKQLIQLLRGEGMSKSKATQAACETVGGTCSPSTGQANASAADLGLVLQAVKKKGRKKKAVSPESGQLAFTPNEKAAIYFSNRRRKDKNMARKKRRKVARKGRRGRKSAARRSTRRRGYRSRRRRTRRSRLARRRRKAARRAARSRRGRGRSRRRARFRRNAGEEAMAQNASEEVTANCGVGPKEQKSYEANARRWKWNRRRNKWNRKLLKETGLLKAFGPEPVAGMMLDSLAERAREGAITLEQYKQLRKQIARNYFPKQERRGGKIGVRVTDPITGKSRVVKVPWRGKIRTAFGPFKRRMRRGMYTYEWAKGEKIPDWALSGAYSQGDYQTLLMLDPNFVERDKAVISRILAARERVRADEMEELQEKIRRLEEKTSKGQVNDPMTPNKRGTRRAGKRKRRMTARQLAAALRNLKKARKALRRKRRSQKSRRRSSRKRRRSSRRKRRSSRRKRRSSRRKRRRGSRRFRKYFAIGDYDLPELLVGSLVGVAGIYLLMSKVAPMFLPSDASTTMVASAPLVSGIVAALALNAIGERVPDKKDYFTGASLIALGAGAGAFGFHMLARVPLGGVPYLNTSGWGSARPLGAYELRGTGAYELRGMGAYPQQALAGSPYTQALAQYELRGMGAYPQQALAGNQYTQALAQYELRGLGQQPYDEHDLLPSQADAALDWADTMVAGEPVPTQLQPHPPLFSQDSLANLGVPLEYGGGIPQVSIWNPTEESLVNDTAPVGGNFDDPNV